MLIFIMYLLYKVVLVLYDINEAHAYGSSKYVFKKVIELRPKGCLAN